MNKSACLLVLLAIAACAPANPPEARRFESLAIRGTAKFGEQVCTALSLLKSNSPAGYATATNYVRVIRQHEHSGMRANENPPTFDLNDRSAFQSVTWCAGVIAHDSFHSKLYHDYKKEPGGRVPDDIWTGHEAEKKCLAHQLRVLIEIGAPEREITHCKTIQPDYADIPYKKRNW